MHFYNGALKVVCFSEKQKIKTIEMKEEISIRYKKDLYVFFEFSRYLLFKNLKK